MQQQRQQERTPPRVTDLVEENVRTIQRIEDELHASGGTTDRLAVRLHDLAGRGTLLWANVIGAAAWVGYNLWPGARPFDAYPFPLLAMVAGVEAIFLAVLILVSQRHAALIADRRSQLALQITLLSEQETTQILVLLQELAQRFGLPSAADDATQALQQQTEPREVAEHIARIKAEEGASSPITPRPP